MYNIANLWNVPGMLTLHVHNPTENYKQTDVSTMHLFCTQRPWLWWSKLNSVSLEFCAGLWNDQQIVSLHQCTRNCYIFAKTVTINVYGTKRWTYYDFCADLFCARSSLVYMNILSTSSYDKKWYKFTRVTLVNLYHFLSYPMVTLCL